jgi:cell division protein ZapA
MKQLEVQIMGQSYLLGCPEGGESSLLDAVNRVDLAMCKIRDAGKVKARDRIAVLAALNLAFETQTAVTKAAETPPPTAVAHDASSAMTPSESARLLALIGQLDAALGQDGRLI